MQMAPRLRSTRSGARQGEKQRRGRREKAAVSQDVILLSNELRLPHRCRPATSRQRCCNAQGYVAPTSDRESNKWPSICGEALHSIIVYCNLRHNVPDKQQRKARGGFDCVKHSRELFV
jgi:hypothetical protein